MSTQIIEQLINEAIADINLDIVITLMAIGFIIKHCDIKFLKNIPNSYIPLILVVFGFIFTFLDAGTAASMQTFISAIVSSAAAVGLHQQGKNIFIGLIPQLTEIIGNLTKQDTETDVDGDA